MGLGGNVTAKGGRKLDLRSIRWRKALRGTVSYGGIHGGPDPSGVKMYKNSEIGLKGLAQQSQRVRRSVLLGRFSREGCLDGAVPTWKRGDGLCSTGTMRGFVFQPEEPFKLERCNKMAESGKGLYIETI